MRRIRIAILSLLLSPSISATADMVRVTGDRVNLRAAALDNAEVVTQVNRGDQLEALSDLRDDWVRVAPPATADFWIFSELVSGAEVAVNRAQVRSGAGLNFNVVGTLKRGDKVVVRGRLGDWVKIAPPKGTALWVSREYIEKAGLGARPAPVVAPIAAASAVQVAPPAPTKPEPVPTPASTPIPATVTATALVPTSAPASAPVAVPTTATVVVSTPPTVPPPPTASTGASAVTSAPAQRGQSTPVTPASVPPAAPIVAGGAAPPARTPPRPTPAPPVRPTGGSPSASWETTASAGAAADAASQGGMRIASPVTPIESAGPRVLMPRNPDAFRTVSAARISADRLVPDAVQGRRQSITGQLAKVSTLFYSPSKYRLVILDNKGKAVTIGFVLGNEKQLEGLVGSRLTMEGPVYWIKSTKHPTIVVERFRRM